MAKTEKIGVTDKKPFTVVKFRDNEKNDEFYIIACGSLKTDDKYRTFEDAEKAIKRKDWKLICLLIEQFYNFMTTQNIK